jgi:glyoxylase-like metal-dependent hydrolase (beta-lactamase superfamily II)
MPTPVYKIHILNNGFVTNFDQSFSVLAYKFGTPTVIPVISYLITGDHIEPILVDTGMDEDRPDILARLGFDVTQEAEHKFAYQLNKIGYRCQDIQCVLFTHLHADHAGNTDLFPNAKLILARKELMYAVSGICFGYPPEFTTYLINQSVIPGRLRLIDDNMELFPGINLEICDGHTWGSLLVKVNTAKGLACICGDVIYDQKLNTRDCPLSPDLAAQRHSLFDPIGVWPTGNNVSKWSNITVMSKIARESDILLPCHDMTVLEEYGDGSEI